MEVKYKGKTYFVQEDAYITGRSIGNGFDYGNRNSGEAYEFEMEARGIDEDGEQVMVKWIFSDIKGEERGLDDYPYEDVFSVTALTNEDY